jgi:hypothetical protein
MRNSAWRSRADRFSIQLCTSGHLSLWANGLVGGRAGVPRGRTAALRKAARDFLSCHAIGGGREMPGRVPKRDGSRLRSRFGGQSLRAQRQNTRVLAAPMTKAVSATRPSSAPIIIWPLWQQIAPALPQPLVVSNHPAGTSICLRIANSPIEDHRTPLRVSVSLHFRHIIQAARLWVLSSFPRYSGL